MNNGATERVAKFASELRYESLPSEVVAKAKQCILDQIGVEIACSTLPWTRCIYDYVRDMAAAGASTVLNYGLKTNEEYAAFANGSFGQSFEIDDVLRADGPAGHPGCTTVPAALAMGEKIGIGGRDLLTAIVIGYEIMGAVSQGVQPTMVLERGFHPNGAFGPFAAAAVAGSVLGLDHEQMMNALGIAGSHASGLMEFSQTGGDVKRIHGGLGAIGGIRSALLASRGYSGPHTVLEGTKGFCRAFSNHPNPEAITRGLGTNYWILRTGFKPYCCNGNISPGVDAILDFRSRNPIPPREIAEIRVGTNRIGVMEVGNIGPEPKTLLEAQFSMHFSLALTMVKGRNDFATYVDTDLKEVEIIETARKVKVQLDEECDRDFLPGGRQSCRMIIKTKGGKTFESYTYAKGINQDTPLSQAELEEKFTGLATRVLPLDRAEEVIYQVRRLEHLVNVSDLVNLLVMQ